MLFFLSMKLRQFIAELRTTIVVRSADNFIGMLGAWFLYHINEDFMNYFLDHSV